MKNSRIIITLFLCLFVSLGLYAQNEKDKAGHINPEDMQIDMDNPTFVPMVKVGKCLDKGDSIQIYSISEAFPADLNK